MLEKENELPPITVQCLMESTKRKNLLDEELSGIEKIAMAQDQSQSREETSSGNATTLDMVTIVDIHNRTKERGEAKEVIPDTKQGTQSQ